MLIQESRKTSLLGLQTFWLVYAFEYVFSIMGAAAKTAAAAAATSPAVSSYGAVPIHRPDCKLYHILTGMLST